MLYKLEKYYASPMQCKNCYHYGHPTSKCRNKTICRSYLNVLQLNTNMKTALVICQNAQIAN